MKRYLKLIVATMIALSAAGFGIANAQSVQDIKSKGKLQVAMDTTYPPYASMGSDMKPVGFEVSLAEMIAQALGVELEIVPVTSTNRLPFLLTKKADLLLSTVTINPTRAAQVMFTNPYTNVGFDIIAETSKPIKAPADLSGLKVGVIRGGAADPLLTAAAPKDATIARLDDVAGCMQALIAGQVDAIAEGSLLPAKLNAAAGSDKYAKKFALAESHLGMAVRPGAGDFLHWLNTFLYVVKQNGQLAAIHEKYMGYPLPQLPTF